MPKQKKQKICQLRNTFVEGEQVFETLFGTPSWNKFEHRLVRYQVGVSEELAGERPFLICKIPQRPPRLERVSSPLRRNTMSLFLASEKSALRFEMCVCVFHEFVGLYYSSSISTAVVVTSPYVYVTGLLIGLLREEKDVENWWRSIITASAMPTSNAGRWGTRGCYRYREHPILYAEDLVDTTRALLLRARATCICVARAHQSMVLLLTGPHFNKILFR